MAEVGDIPARFEIAAAIVRHLLTDPVLPADLLPPGWPGPELRECYTEFAARLAQRREPLATLPGARPDHEEAR